MPVRVDLVLGCYLTFEMPGSWGMGAWSDALIVLLSPTMEPLSSKTNRPGKRSDRGERRKPYATEEKKVAD